MDLITGATGFIGQRLAHYMAQSHHPVRLLARRPHNDPPVHPIDLSDQAGLQVACSGIDRVFHCAGHAHAFSSFTDEENAQHWRVNFEGTRSLVEAAGHAGVRRFVFLSSVKAMGEPGEICADEDFPGQPLTAYGQSKRAAEAAVLAAGKKYSIHVVNLRLAMVYGAGGRGNLERMGRLVKKGWFPPLPETGNHRSLVHVNDVVDIICRVAEDDRAKGRTYIIAGPQAPSGRELFDTMRTVLGLSACRWAVPSTALRLAARCGDGLETLCKRRVPLNSETLDRLLTSAWYSSDRIERELGWRATISLEDGLREMFGR
jgi:nucleoside-diphosphate-sugar epimerase